MENLLMFNATGFRDYEYWQFNDKKTLKRINILIKEIQRGGPLEGIGKPEAMRYRGGYSRRIDEKNRLEYEYVSDKEGSRTLITACAGHYSETGTSSTKKSLLQGLQI